MLMSPGSVVGIWNASTWKADTGGSWVPDHPGLYNKILFLLEEDELVFFRDVVPEWVGAHAPGVGPTTYVLTGSNKWTKWFYLLFILEHIKLGGVSDGG